MDDCMCTVTIIDYPLRCSDQVFSYDYKMIGPMSFGVPSSLFSMERMQSWCINVAVGKRAKPMTVSAAVTFKPFFTHEDLYDGELLMGPLT